MISVILSTYNSPTWLEKVLWGYSVQTLDDFEIVVADDGSTEETRAVIDSFASGAGLNLRHVWHEDKGFRKTKILNRAVSAAGGEYLVFADGDCIPRADFLSQHARHARPGQFLSGGAVRLPLGLSRRVEADDITAGRATNAAWLVHQGHRDPKARLRLSGSPLMGWLCDALPIAKSTLNGNNSSAWKRDVVHVNGFDERMRYGGEDCELGDRLINAGLRAKRIRYRAACVHLDHPRGYVTREMLEQNAQIRRETRKTKRCWTPFGIVREACTPSPV